MEPRGASKPVRAALSRESPPGRLGEAPSKESSARSADPATSEAMSDWLRELARQEHDRLAEMEKFNQAAGPFLAALYQQILADLEGFRREFPGTFIDSNFDPQRRVVEVINHSRSNPAPQVRISANSTDQTLQLAFEFRPSLNKELPMGMRDGKLAVDMNGGVSEQALSQLALTPVLFPELTSNTLLYDSFTEASGLR
jgi:hypothetical protein